MTKQREARGWSQAELAAAAGISRAAVSAVELRRGSPSVRAALALAGALGASVEELFTDGTDPKARWAWPPREADARFWEVRDSRGTLRYPAESLAANPLPHDGRFLGDPPPPTLTLASCDPAAGLLAAEYSRMSDCRMLVFSRNGADALELLRRDLVHVGGLHASTEEHPEANLDRVRAKLGPGWILARAAIWESGIAHPDSQRMGALNAKSLASRRWALREPGAAARDFLDAHLDGRKPRGRVVTGHREVAQAVRAGWADAGVCVRLCAEEERLAFTPTRREMLDLVFSERWLEDRRIRALLDLLGRRAWRDAVSALPGYDGGETGGIVHIRPSA